MGTEVRQYVGCVTYETADRCKAMLAHRALFADGLYALFIVHNVEAKMFHTADLQDDGTFLFSVSCLLTIITNVVAKVLFISPSLLQMVCTVHTEYRKPPHP